MHEAVNRPGVTPNPAHSQGMIATGLRTLYISGQVGSGPDGKTVDGIEAQTRAALLNLVSVLGAAGMTLADIVKFTVYLTDERDMPGFMPAFVSRMPTPPPAGTLVVVKALASPHYLVEIEAIAVQ